MDSVRGDFRERQQQRTYRDVAKIQPFESGCHKHHNFRFIGCHEIRDLVVDARAILATHCDFGLERLNFTNKRCLSLHAIVLCFTTAEHHGCEKTPTSKNPRLAAFKSLCDAQYIKCGKGPLLAIPFVLARPIKLAKYSSATWDFAYVGRAVMADPRAEVPLFDYSHLRDDLAHVEVLLPPNVPQYFLEPAVLAHALDAVELRKIRTPLSARIRKPQVVMAVIVALPPEFEVSLNEALIIARRIVRYPCGSHPIPIHLAIHNASINRHAHADIGLRPMNPDGSFGLKIQNLFARFGSYGDEIRVAEGTGWPDLSWEIQQTFFTERGMDLVVDPPAPAPERHVRAKIPDGISTQWINIQRQQRRLANLNMIKGSPTHLIEGLLKGRSALRVAELHRLCARFIDNEDDRRAQVDRILVDENVTSLTDTAEPTKQRYVTTRRIARLMDRTAKLIDRAGDKIAAVTRADHDAVAERLSELYGTHKQGKPPLILGSALSHCERAAQALADYHPVLGTLDMVMGTPDQRVRGRKRGVYIERGRLIMVPRAELVDDRRLARLTISANESGSALLLGHDQGRQTGIVCRGLAAHVADRPQSDFSVDQDEGRMPTIERLLRSGLLRRGVEAMVNLGVINFSTRPDVRIGDALQIMVLDNPVAVEDVNNTIKTARRLAGANEERQTLAGPHGEITLSIGAWIVTLGRRGLPSSMDAHQLAQVVAIDAVAGWIEVVRHGEVARLHFVNGPAIRSADAISIRDAWDAPSNTNLVIKLTNPRQVWAGLLLASTRIGNAQIYVDPALAQTPADLLEAARRSVPGALPSHWVAKPDADAVISKMLGDLDPFPEIKVAIPEPPPPPLGFAEDVRHRISKNAGTQLAYRLLHEHLTKRHPDHEANLKRLLDLCGSELTKSVILFMAERDEMPDVDDVDFPLELAELEPRHWSGWELYKFELDLNLMTIRAAGWGLLPSVGPKTDRLSTPLNALNDP
ncbi:hypothetical protein FNL55_07880 [Tardiphaga sp. vice352]|uniref:MobA/MobL family protein n=1 Tax=Tardiphaga sp. vice352 TaxID=2592816 RepID=UPI0011642EC7|nr:MobA/MobL family protein [Tardiphaga sp. vice352]QDM31222.1 hypothetical protein FNL55_07880 [Tardiphaga sp. vice352]